jgi:hypothetical protein
MLPSLKDLLPEFVFCTAFWDKVCAINAMIHLDRRAARNINAAAMTWC